MAKIEVSVFRKWAAVILLLAAPAVTHAQSDFCNTKNTAYKGGEKLTFKVYYNMGFLWIYAGNAVFSIQGKEIAGQKLFHITGDGKTAPSYEWFYKVRDLYESYIDQETLLPVRFIRNVNEGGLKFSQDVTFNHATHTAISKGKPYTIPNCTQDVLSAIYYARSIDYSKYKPGDKIPFEMFLDDKVYPLYIKYLGKEKIETKRGVFNTIKIAPLLIEGTMFSGGEKMTVWVSDDKNHVPVRINSPIVVGSIKVDLMEYENLRNPFSSILSLN
jgi:hypothetical protein